MTKAAVIILNWNGEKLLKEFLPSVIKNTNHSMGRVIVADNASEDKSVEILEKEFPGIEVIRFDQNYGFAGGYNRAIELVDEEIIVL
ncbi:MAG: glycosyltransferase, partial [Odoribacter sp.]